MTQHSFIPPPGDIKTFLTIPSIRPRTTVDIVAFKISMQGSSLIGFRCRFVAVSVPQRKSFQFFNPRRNPCLQVEQKTIFELRAMLRHVVEQKFTPF